jgi:hypothetical protein
MAASVEAPYEDGFHHHVEVSIALFGRKMTADSGQQTIEREGMRA